MELVSYHLLMLICILKTWLTSVLGTEFQSMEVYKVYTDSNPNGLTKKWNQKRWKAGLYKESSRLPLMKSDTCLTLAIVSTTNA